MTDNNELIYPTVDLFLYDLADGLGQSDDKITQNQREFWGKVYEESLINQQLDELKKIEAEPSDYIELLEDGLNFNSDDDGYYYPVKLGDTYALQVDCSASQESPEKKFAPKSLDCLKTLKQTIRTQIHEQRGKIGESWLVWGQLAADDQKPLETAMNSYKNLELFPNPNWDQDLQNQGEFLGAIFYELWRVPSDRGDLTQNYHLLICLFPYNKDESIQVAADIMPVLYKHFIRLFNFRNKIIWAYHQSRQLKLNLKLASPQIQTLVNQLPEQVNASKLDLKKLQQNLADALQIFSGYANSLSSLEEQQQTIKTHLINYQRRLKKLAKLDQKSKPELGSKDKAINGLEFLETFTDFANEKYLPQIEADVASLSAGLRLLENATKTIEGIIEIEQTKSEQDLAFIVGFGGISLAASGITATIVSTKIPPPEPNSKITTQEPNSKITTQESNSKITTQESNLKGAMSIPTAFVLSFLICLPFLIALLIRFVRR